MTMVSSGPISLGGTATTSGLNQSVNVELGRSGTASINMNESAVRTLAGVPSGAISMNNFYGKANQFSFTISINHTNANLATLATTAGWNGTSKLVATVASGVYLSSNSTGTPGLTINGSFPGGVDLINNGFIIGMGGAGGAGRNVPSSGGSGGSAGSSGGLALSVSSAVTITNNNTIGGGGGGGGGGQGAWNSAPSKPPVSGAAGGSGGGGGRSGTSNSAGGSGGTVTWSEMQNKYTGNNGNQGTLSSAGGGGAAVTVPQFNNARAGAGGNGGDWGAAGSGGGTQQNMVAAGGPFGGGSAGAAISGNANITWITFGTRLGAIS